MYVLTAMDTVPLTVPAERFHARVVRKLIGYLVASVRKIFGIGMESHIRTARKVLKIECLVWDLMPTWVW
jgi:hypothetical protein